MSHPDTRAYDAVKRALDIVVGALGLVITLPIQAAAAALVLASYGRPVFFRQPRPGKDGKIFELVKLRTMKHRTEALQTDEQRLTRLGQFLRSTSVDELPSLWNVVKGEMSVVGPRPLLVKYLPLYTAGQARRHEVRPGMTGLAQTKGRNGVGWDEKFRLDVEYVESRSLKLDVRILLRTVGCVVRRTGINQVGQVTMTEFRGSSTGSQS